MRAGRLSQVHLAAEYELEAFGAGPVRKAERNRVDDLMLRVDTSSEPPLATPLVFFSEGIPLFVNNQPQLPSRTAHFCFASQYCVQSMLL